MVFSEVCRNSSLIDRPEEGPTVQQHHGMGEVLSQLCTAEILDTMHPGCPFINRPGGQGHAAPSRPGHC